MLQGVMLDISAIELIGVPVEMRTLKSTIDHIDEKNAVLGTDDRSNILLPHAEKLISALSSVEARSALASTNRMQEQLQSNPALTYAQVASMLGDIESRFADHLNDIKLLYLSAQEATLFEPAEQLLATSGTPVAEIRDNFPSACFEIEECSKCLALGRQTAAVFHAMRVMELGLAALAKHLNTPDPVKASDRNWGNVLNAVKTKIDEKWPVKSRLPDSEGTKMEALYVTIDAVKNPWRNSTMHVEQIYAPHEAIHIARCTSMFILELMNNGINEPTT
jgi:hypothetical protein